MNPKNPKTKITINDDRNFKVDRQTLKQLVNKILISFKKKFENININFIDSNQTFELNKFYLKHNTNTDVITFSYSDIEPYSADIFISYEMALYNSKKYKVTFESEILRLIVHSILHILGYKDKSAQQKHLIHKMEDEILDKIKLKKFIKKSPEISHLLV
ncbi:MAG: rRNA maturation RNase YbeY [Ignavibacteria bacterium]|nr:rRNA maturation RNase YbeY [Ignavibacteria bacterium]